MLQLPPSRTDRPRVPVRRPRLSPPETFLGVAGALKRVAAFFYAFLIARYLDIIGIAVRRSLVIFFRNGGLGDVLCTFPAATRIVKDHPEAYTIYCTHPDFVSLPRSVGLFNRVMGIKMSDMVASLISARHTVHRFNYPDEKAENVSVSYLADEFSTSNGLPAVLPWPDLNLGSLCPRVADVFRGSTTPVICIHTGPTWPVREWPLVNWDEFVSRLREQMQVRVIQIGASRHFTEGARIERAVEGAEDLRDRFSLLESLQIISRSNLVVAIDSGLIHGAVALNVPLLGLFGPTSAKLRLPQRYDVRSVSAEIPCLGCHHRLPRLHTRSSCPHDIGCMKNLSAQRVVNEAIELLQITKS